jgi:hypothetical protein
MGDQDGQILLYQQILIKGDSPMDKLKNDPDAKVTIEKIEEKGRYKARVTIEILNPVPKSAKFFKQVNPDQVFLNGTHNKIWKHFNTEEQGRQWANDILLAVMRKSYGEEMRGAFISPEKEIDITFHPSSDTFFPCIKKPDCFGEYEGCVKSFFFKSGANLCPFISSCKDTPKCIGNYPLGGGKCASCPEPHFNICQGVVDKKKEQDIKPSCFGYCNVTKDWCHACSYKDDCQELFEGIERVGR